MKKNIIIYIILILLVCITVGSFAIYKSILNGNIEANFADVIVELNSSSGNLNINTNALSTEYNFSVNNYTTISNVVKVNEVLCEYYLKVTGLSDNIFNVNLYYIDSSNVETLLTLETTGEYSGYYKALGNLEIDNQIVHNYRLEISVDSNNIQSVIKNISIDVGYKQVFTENSHVNPPELIDEFIPIAWDDTNNNWYKISASDSNWYNYENKEWANVATVSHTYNTNQSYKDAPDGTPIPHADIMTMWVWIPRFVYKINGEYYHRTILEGSGLQEPPVQIHFSKTQSTGGDEWDNNIVVNTGTKAIDSVDSWTTHPAFSFGDKYINGFWMAKFQASNSAGLNNGTIDDIYIKPCVHPAVAIAFDTLFNACRNMETKALYGWPTVSGLQNDSTFSSELVTNNGFDIHLTKNSEWAAVAFLTHSKYGQGEIDIVDSQSTQTPYTGGSNDIQVVCTAGAHQSTTNTEYGVYDMANTVWDYVAGFIGTGDNIGANTLYYSLPRYKDQYIVPGQSIDYSSKDSVYAIFENIKGAAIWETSVSGNASYSTWFAGRSNIGSYSSNKYNLILTRGGAYKLNDVVKDTIFSFGNAEGSALNDTRAFRPVMIVNPEL